MVVRGLSEGTKEELGKWRIKAAVLGTLEGEGDALCDPLRELTAAAYTGD